MERLITFGRLGAKRAARIHQQESGTKKASEKSLWSYYAGVDEIYHSKWTANVSASLSSFREAVDHFWPNGYPIKLIQVAGTSGKGSTCKFLQSGLSYYGKSGCYVKPHVFDYAERFTVNDGQVGHEEILATWYEQVKPFVIKRVAEDRFPLDHPEVSLLIALLLFERHHLQWAAIETGIGGRYDPVSTLDVVATVITNVGRDHEDVLGSEHWQRALEKAGVSRPGVPLILGDDNPQTVEVIEAYCRDTGTPLIKVIGTDIKKIESALGRLARSKQGNMFDGSRHQLQNAVTAIKTIQTLVKSASIDELLPRLLKTEFVGRFWRIEEDVYADVAHNPSKTSALAKEIQAKFPRKRKVFVIGITGKRNPVEVLAPLVPQAKAIVVTSAGYKGQDPEAVYSILREAYPALAMHLSTKPKLTLKVAKSLRSKGEPIIFTGSTYMIDQALNPDDRLRHLNGVYGWREVRK